MARNTLCVEDPVSYRCRKTRGSQGRSRKRGYISSCKRVGRRCRRISPRHSGHAPRSRLRSYRRRRSSRRSRRSRRSSKRSRRSYRKRSSRRRRYRKRS